MKNARQILLLAAVLAAGGAVSAILDWRQEHRAAAWAARRSAEGLVGLLPLYPFGGVGGPSRHLLIKALVEQSEPPVAYLVVAQTDGEPLLVLGEPNLRGADSATAATAPINATPTERRFAAPDGRGQIMEFSRAFHQEGGGVGTIVLGVRFVPPPVLSSSRISSVGAAVFLMLAAVIVGYYGILLALRRWSRGSAAPASAAMPGARRAHLPRFAAA